MGHGLGPAQKRMLEVLEGPGALSIAELAEIVGLTMRRCREIAHSLADRKLVVIRREHLGWKGIGEYGILAERSDVLRSNAFYTSPPGPGKAGPAASRFEHLEHLDVEALPIIVIKSGEEVPGRQRTKAGGYRATHGIAPRPMKVYRDTEFVHIGVPVSGLMVWEIGVYRAQRAREIRNYEALGVRLGSRRPVTEAEIIELFGPEV
jgi:hypothetical protein